MRTTATLCAVVLCCLAAAAPGAVMAQDVTAKLGNTNGAKFVVTDSGSGNIMALQAGTLSPNVTIGYKLNTIASGVYGGTISGGGYATAVNEVKGIYGTVGGGALNIAGSSVSDENATVGGGYANIASKTGSTVAGGWNNTASGLAATVPGGYLNTAGGNYSFAAGVNANAANANSFIWSDRTTTTQSTTFDNQVIFYYGSGGAYVEVHSGATGWNYLSDRAHKENFKALDGTAVLRSLAAMPVMEFNIKGSDPSIRRVGPTAQDFYAAFRLGDSDKAIGTGDAAGVTMAAVQGLYKIVQEKDAEIGELKTEIKNLKAQHAATAAHQAQKMLLLEAAVEKLRKAGLSREVKAETAAP